MGSESLFCDGGCHQCHNLGRNWWHTLTFLGLDTPEVSGCEGLLEATDKDTVRPPPKKKHTPLKWISVCAPFACVYTAPYSMPFLMKICF